jgi:hypothetical protein
MPEEATAPLAYIQEILPYSGEITHAGYALHEQFQRRLVTPYQEADFWHEVINRIAVVRLSVNEAIWRILIADRPLPENASDLDDAWRMLLEIPWIRPRSNGRFVTLHDAVAEEIANRVIRLHDHDQQWRRVMWQRMVRIYAGLTEPAEMELGERLA